MALDDVYTEVLGEHSRNPDHKHKLSCATCQMKGKNPSCGDEITIELQVEDGIVKDAAFTGVGCAISQASTDIMAELIRGKSVDDARRLAHKFISMIKGELVDEDELEELDEALALKNVAHMPARVKCAVLAWHTLDDALKEQK
ncbi:putative FeS cluster assembly scaffold protein NifU [Selenomonas ruminantium subsp. lactilytica TAM6421]|uniref:Putative FeS cluster assembly scaffold protein NifU n=1 Tax=Selenomonas ruminantium subsp. lactilytica (strain NBRC 103574 / TAM6421) TaxID=927704 RepID=I0GM25_SELRL|nr:SUF system NifU family Fe-S cluster assembly protein [Selenomonas ruminantium]BAL81812.1 putative FeS cluster assembly scaffold protein NifU [Selenomonas ruminantium subsp. lactilytica TAM6421]